MSPPDHLPDDSDQLAAAFEHSITWEDDIWRADPVDVEAVHAKARAKFYDLLEAVASDKFTPSKPRILLFHGQSGAGKTHLIRALRTGAHRRGKAYFGYAQMTPDVSSYADYYLRRLVNSLEKPYDPDTGGESGLSRLTRKLVGDAEVMDVAELARLREAELDEAELARFVLDLADDIVASPKFAEENLDINLVRALLYMQRSDPRIDQRVRQYLQGRQLTDLARTAVGAGVANCCLVSGNVSALDIAGDRFFFVARLTTDAGTVSRIFTFDLSSGALVTSPAPLLSSTNNYNFLGWDPTPGTLFAVVRDTTNSDEDLLTINPTTAAVAQVGASIPDCCGVSSGVGAVDPNNNRFLFLGVRSSLGETARRLWTLDLADGSVDDNPLLSDTENYNWVEFAADPLPVELLDVGVE